MCTEPHQVALRRSMGFTLVEVLLVMVVLGVIAVTLFTTSAHLAGSSSHSLKLRSAYAFAQALLDEVLHMPYTHCDPVGAACLGVDALGPEPGETRYSAVNRFDGVSDYHDFSMPDVLCAGLCDLYGNLLNGPGSPLSGCAARVTVGAVPMAGVAALDLSGAPQVLRILVTVTCPGVDPAIAEGIRARHAPRAY